MSTARASPWSRSSRDGSPLSPACRYGKLTAMTTFDAEPPSVEGEEHAPLPDDLLAPAAIDVAVDDAQTRCRTCGSPLTEGEDWCLTCGAATVPPRRTPGLRAVALAGSLALVLAGGAVAASYAALNDEPPHSR